MFSFFLLYSKRVSEYFFSDVFYLATREQVEKIKKIILVWGGYDFYVDKIEFKSQRSWSEKNDSFKNSSVAWKIDLRPLTVNS